MEILCPAKVNLALSVGAAREDGYHPIASWMVAVGFADHLALSLSDTTRFEIAFADDAPVKQPVDWPIEKDLGWRAHRLLEQHADRPLPTRVVVTKRIPAGGGLGGGSADAAGVLVGVNALHGLGFDTSTLIQLGATLGCDVAFAVAALSGSPSAIATGLGEVLEPAPLPRPIDLVLILPPFGCPTGPVYAAFDHGTPPANRADESRVRSLVRSMTDHQTMDGWFNDLTVPACIAQPRLGDALKLLGDLLDRPMHVTGSGSTMFAIARDTDDARLIASRIHRHTGLAAVATRTLG